MSNVAFFPGYPLLAWIITKVFYLDSDFALLIVSNVCLLFATILLREYLNLRFPNKTNEELEMVLLLFCIMPTSVFFRMAYTESLFVLLCIAVMYGIEKGWAAWKIAVIVGASTGTRSMGIVMVAPLVIYIFASSSSFKKAALTVLATSPLAAWGIVTFAIYLWYRIGNPLAFLEAQSAWEFRTVPSFFDRVFDLATLEPIRSTYDSNDKSLYWGRFPPIERPEFSLLFWNPIVWAFSVFGCAIGIKQSLLKRTELAMCIGLLLLPYYLQGARAGMMSAARYSSVVFPLYWIYADLTLKTPALLRHFATGIAMVYLFICASLFTQWYWVF